MANPKHFSILKRDVATWNQWRADNSDIRPDLSEANLHGAILIEANLREAILTGAILSEATLFKADLSGANLREAILHEANLHGAILTEANLLGAFLTKADLSGANLTKADLREAFLNQAILSEANLHGAILTEANLLGAFLTKADLSGANLRQAFLDGAYLNRANLRGAILIEADLYGATLFKADLSEADLTAASLEVANLVYARCDKAIFTGCRIHGLSAWDLQLAGAQQTNLVITPEGTPDITVDNIEVAQFIYLFLNNQRIRDVIDTITSKVVLILGRFTPERKVVLDAIRDQLRRRDHIPVLFDFEKPRNQTTLETINTLANMARFVIADITDAKSVLEELTMIVPYRPRLPIQPVLLASQEEGGHVRFLSCLSMVLRNFSIS